MRKQRLLKLADLIESETKRKDRKFKFDMKTWGTAPYVEGDGGNAREMKLDHCGTACCAMGLAALSGAFKRAGLGYELCEGYDLREDRPTLELSFILGGEHYHGFNAARRLFDIDSDEAFYLFCPDEYRSNKPKPATVAKRIRDFVANNGAHK